MSRGRHAAERGEAVRDGGVCSQVLASVGLCGDAPTLGTAGRGDCQGRRRGRAGGSGSGSSLPSVAGLYFKGRFREKAGFRKAAGERETCFGVTSHADKPGKG